TAIRRNAGIAATNADSTNCFFVILIAHFSEKKRRAVSAHIVHPKVHSSWFARNVCDFNPVFPQTCENPR
ncbi:MAG: hypothetical protein ACKON9_29875, partial [Planctomycetaceae bacterium]